MVIGFLCLLAALDVAWCFRHEYILYYGDALAHLNNSRSLIDSRTPGYDQLGTPWLPLLHVICLPFVGNDWLWRTGLAGSIPVALCFVVAATVFYFAAEQAYESTIAAVVALGCFALNPNVLYLASIPMTEIVFLAGMETLLLAILRYRSTQARAYLVLGILASWAMSLTRFDGWFLIPFSALAFAFVSNDRKLRTLVYMGALMSLVPLYWFAHNWWETGNALDFINGPYSPAAIQGTKPYPGHHNWGIALKFYSKAGELCAGWSLVVLGTLGIVCAAYKRKAAPLLLLLLTPAFYVLSIHSSATPVWMPEYWFGSYYNIRYGIAVIPLLAFASGAIVLALPFRLRKFSLIIPVIALAPWIFNPSIESVICWKEAEFNSVARRAWTAAGAQFLENNYQRGEGILLSAGDVTGILSRSQTHISESLNIGNGPAWLAATARPDLVHSELWAIAQSGDSLSNAIARQRVPVYVLFEEIRVKGAPPLQIFRRQAGPLLK